MAQARKKAKPRPTQSERRDATRKRILDATLYCLARHGYAGTGVAQVVAKARVSRGAWSHHFPSMDALILESAQYLMAKVYERLGVVMNELSQADPSVDSLRSLVYTAWREFFASEVNEIYLELLIASRRDPKLAAMLSSLSRNLENNLGSATDSRFTALPGAANNPTEIMHLNRWILRGIALDAPLMPKGAVEQALDAWCRLAATQMQSRGSGASATKRSARSQG